MATKVRPQLSKKNKYWISKHRYYELKHFCLQYPEWKELLRDAAWLTGEPGGDPEWSDPTSGEVCSRERLVRQVRMVEDCAYAASSEIGSYILKAVTEDLSFVHLSMIDGIPCGKDMYYDRYRRFFWLLDMSRNQQCIL